MKDLTETAMKSERKWKGFLPPYKLMKLPLSERDLKSYEKLLDKVIQIQYKEIFHNDLKNIWEIRTTLNKKHIREELKQKNILLLSRSSFLRRGKEIKASLAENYFKKFKGKENLFKVMRAAVNNSRGHLMKLIQYDKSWLYINWVKREILQGQSEDDKDFFEALSTAIKLKRKDRLKYKSETFKKVLDFIDQETQRKLMAFHLPTRNLDDLYERVYSLLVDKNILSLNEDQLKEIADLNILNSKVYFKQFVKMRVKNSPSA